MKIDTYKSGASVKSLYANGLPLTCHPFDVEQEYEPNSWVQLLELPNPFSHDQALLLCQQTDNEWVAWIPDHGETVLTTNQFRPIA